jgi:phosphoribosylamine--glycine ligase
MRALVIGSGGREHALVRVLAESESRPELWAYPGNPGIFEYAHHAQLPATIDGRHVAAFCHENQRKKKQRN